LPGDIYSFVRVLE